MILNSDIELATRFYRSIKFTSDIAGATYTWTVPPALLAARSTLNLNLRSIQIPNVGEEAVGEYSVNVNFGTCTVTSKTSLAVSTCDNLYIKAYDPITNLETNKLKRKPNIPAKNEYENLNLVVQTLEGNILKNMTYVWDPNRVTNPSKTWEIQVNQMGNYKVDVSNASGVRCPLSIDIFAEKCDPIDNVFNCGTGGINPPINGASNIANLAVGDEFTVRDYTVRVTKISGSQAAGWSGEGGLTFNFLKIGNNIALEVPITVTFDNIQVNQCYQLITGGVRTKYDPNWENNLISLPNFNEGSIEDSFNKIYSSNTNIIDIVKVFTCSDEQKQLLNKELDIQKKFVIDVQNSNDLTNLHKAEIVGNLNQTINDVTSLLACCVASTNGRILSINCSNPQIIIDNITTAQNSFKTIENYTLENATLKIMIFANGYRLKKTGLVGAFIPVLDVNENPDTDNSINLSDDKGYWVGIESEFKNRRKSRFQIYLDGHHSLTTSNHNIRNNVNQSVSHFKDQMIYSLMASQPAPLISAILLKNNSLIVKTASCYLNESCVTLDTSPNIRGFNVRYENGRIAAENFYKIINKNGNGSKVKLEIDIVAHSMGFAYAQGFISQINSMVAGNRIKNVDWSGYYIIAPENGCSGTINDSDGWEQVYQYGSDEISEKKYYQDGVAPQCPIINIGNRRVFIPNKYYDDKVIPKDYVSSHSIGNYKWIFDGVIPPTGPNSKGYVTSK